MSGLAELIKIYDSPSGLPIYLQIARQIKILAATGGISQDQELPSVRELSKVLGIAPMTVSKSYALLKEGGYVSGKQGARLNVTDKCIKQDKWEIIRSDLVFILGDAKSLMGSRDVLLAKIAEMI